MTMPLRRFAPLVLVVTAAGCSSGGSGTPSPSPSATMGPQSSATTPVRPASTDCPFSSAGTRTVRIVIVDDGATGKCRVDDVRDDPVVACVYDNNTADAIGWRLINRCTVRAKVQIANRKRESAGGTVDEPFTSANVFEKTVAQATSSAGTVIPGTADIAAEKLVDAAGVGGAAILYKYDITGDVQKDPEIDVRRGTGTGGEPGPVPIAPKASPGQKR